MSPRKQKQFKLDQYDKIDNKLRCKTCKKDLSGKSSHAVLKTHYDTHKPKEKTPPPEPVKDEILRSLLQRESTVPMPGGAGMSSGGMGAGMSSSMQSVAGSVSGSSMPGQSSSQGMVQSQMQQHPQGMMIGGSIGQQVQQVGGKGPRPVTQLDGLEAARQHNLEKIQHLQQTLEAAHQQEAQFKSQMDIMSHLHAAQQQEQHYKQLEEQQRKHQMQQQLQQQRAAGGVSHPPRVMRPMLPSNPGLRHLLQQQQQPPRGSRPPHM